MVTTMIKNSKYRIHGNIHQGTTVTLTLLLIYSRDTMVTVTISSVLIEPKVISCGQNRKLVIFSKKP